jgi:phosphate transport system substrate-binding protein
MRKTFLTTTAITVLLSVTAFAAKDARPLRLVGSSTVFPFATTVAEHFSKIHDFSTPVVEETGTGGGLKLFCEGEGKNAADIANASRPIKDSELALCAKNGIKDVVELQIGYDGIIISNGKSAATFGLTTQQLFLALAKHVPVKGKIVANPYKTWHDVDSNLPKQKIEVYGPPPTSGTRDAFVELVMERGCGSFPEITALKEGERQAVCKTLREDGAFIEAGENDNIIIQRIETNSSALGVFGYSYLEQNAQKIKALTIDGVSPTFENIADGKYPVARSLFVYFKKSHLKNGRGLQEFLTEFTSEEAMSDDGYLVDKGLIPLMAELREAQRARLKDAKTLEPAAKK